jgi:hypothetical protein
MQTRTSPTNENHSDILKRRRQKGKQRQRNGEDGQISTKSELQQVSNHRLDGLATFGKTDPHASYSAPAKGPVHTSDVPHKDARQECFGMFDQLAADVIAGLDLDRRLHEAELEEYNQDRLSDEVRVSLFQAIRGHVKKLSFDPAGCRLVQRILDLTTDSAQQQMAYELKGHVKEAVESAHCNHVLQRCIELMRPSAVEFVLCEIEDQQVRNLAKHRYGCRVLERIIEHFSLERLTVLLDEIISHAQELCFDQYGNFVIQHLLEHGNDEHKEKIVTVILRNLRAVALDTQACSVLDKAVSYTKLDKKLAEAILAEEGLLVDISLSRFGYAATQSLCRVFSRSDDVSGQGKGTANKPLMEIAQSQLKAMLPRLEQSKHGRAVLSSLLTVFPALNATGYTDDEINAMTADLMRNAVRHALPGQYIDVQLNAMTPDQLRRALKDKAEAERIALDMSTCKNIKESVPRQGCFRNSRQRRGDRPGHRKNQP